LSRSATAFTGTRTGDVTGTLIDCGIGRIDQIPPAVAGNIAMLRMDAAIPFGQAFGNVIHAGAAAIRNALAMSARDAGPKARDDDYGWGIVDAFAAAQLLSPEKLPPASPRRRAVH